MSEVANQKAIEDMSFREGVAEVENIVGVLQSNTLELEDSITSFERGVKLLGNLQSRLNNAQQKVDVLVGELQPEVSDAERDTTLS